MNKIGTLALACAVTLTIASTARAQEKPGGPGPSKKDSFEELLKSYRQGGGSHRFVVGDTAMKHGEFVTVTAKGMDPISGVFVWADPKSGKVYIRQKAGMPPIAVPGRDIEKIRPAAGAPDKGGVKPAIEGEAQAAPGNEIHTMTIQDGPNTRTYFFDSSLSPAERDQLGAIERAGTDLAQKAALVESLRNSLENAANDSGVTVIPGGGGYGGYGYMPPYLGYPYYYPVAYYNLYYYLYYPMFGGYPYGYGGFPGYYGGGYGGGGGGGGSTVVVNNSGGGSGVAALSKSLAEAQNALTDAQKTYAAVRNRGIYDSDGRIIAVRLEE
jgi:hypothetical protein